MTRISRAAMMGLAWAVVWVPVGLVGGRLIVGELEPEHIGGPLFAGVFVRAATMAAAVSGLLAGVLPWILGHQNGTERFFPIAVIAGLSGLGATAAFVARSIARWFNRQNSAASRLRQGSGG